MKKLLKVMTLFVAMTLTACGGSTNSGEASGQPADGSSGQPATSQPAGESSAPAASSAGGESKSSKHTHYAAENAEWQNDENRHWKLCADGDGGKVDNKAHTFEEKADDPEAKAASCKEAGVKVEVCTVCGYKKKTELDKLAHTYVDDPTDPANKEATCSEPGVKVQVCSACGDRQEIPVLAEHDLQPFEHTTGEGEVTETIKKCSKDEYYQFEFNADDSAATFSVSSDKKSGYVKLSKQVAADGSGSASTVEYKIWSPVAMKGRFWIDITGNTSSQYDRETKEGNQALFYTHTDPTTNINDWKNKVELNDAVVDFDNATYEIDGKEIEYKELMYSDFGTLADSSGATISVPMPEVNLLEGVNTLKFTRITGYAFNMHKFTFKANIF